VATSAGHLVENPLENPTGTTVDEERNDDERPDRDARSEVLA
jgi:hypothetical protein